MPLTTYAEPMCVEVQSPAKPVEAFSRIVSRRLPFFLDSGMDAKRLGRFSFLGCEPFLILRAVGHEAILQDAEGRICARGHPFALLRQSLTACAGPPANAPVPFVGGAVGCLSYDLCHLIERLPRTAKSDLSFPSLHMAFYAELLAYDHLEERWWVVAWPLDGETARSKRRRLDAMLRLLDDVSESAAPVGVPAPPCMRQVARGNFTHEGYCRAVERAREYIFAGDIFQVNLSQRFEVLVAEHPWDVYRVLRTVNPAPFAAYIDLGGQVMVGASPERFLLVRNGHVVTRPIKGTRRRAGEPTTDARARAELLSSTKDRAELTMIVDLERNDLGRVCQYGSVQVTEPIVLEEYPSVFHLVATVEGDLHPRHDIVDLLKATFPGGSITGAPKIRAMEIIDELEPTQRSLYTGSCGYLGFDGSADLNIVIRTILMEGRRATFQVGGAIVADSDPEAEYQETLDKGQRLFAALGAKPPE